MARISLAGFKDPIRRPRYIVWSVVILLVFIAVMIPLLGVTSTRWFCSNACHKVQDDTIIAYQHSSHSNISCMSCHMPVNASPVIFMMHKVEALGELYLTVTNKFELPLNGESEYSLTLKSTQCTQCHNLANRPVTPSPGIKIDHNKHIEKQVTCPTCHNRIAHREDFDLTLKDPTTGEPNKKHEDFMKMDACFRCHGQEDGAPAPGTCETCHTTGFELKPPSHFASNFATGHAEMAKQALEKVDEVLKERGITTSITGEAKAEWQKPGGDSKETTAQKIIPAAAVFYCGTCHNAEFCINCHGTTMPHSDTFKGPEQITDPAGHPVAAKTIPEKCVMCHGANAVSHFCDNCHHGVKIDYEFQPSKPWILQHPTAVAKSGLKSCTESCHPANFCADCHLGRNVLPSSHRARNWVRPRVPSVSYYGTQTAVTTAGHAAAARESSETCIVCHAGGTKAPLCMSCHKIPMPHPANFGLKDESQPAQAGNGGEHATILKKARQSRPAVCANCHLQAWCDSCHHKGLNPKIVWRAQHMKVVKAKGASSCFASGGGCHEETFCSYCHVRLGK